MKRFVSGAGCSPSQSRADHVLTIRSATVKSDGEGSYAEGRAPNTQGCAHRAHALAPNTKIAVRIRDGMSVGRSTVKASENPSLRGAEPHGAAADLRRPDGKCLPEHRPTILIRSTLRSFGGVKEGATRLECVRPDIFTAGMVLLLMRPGTGLRPDNPLSSALGRPSALDLHSDACGCRGLPVLGDDWNRLRQSDLPSGSAPERVVTLSRAPGCTAPGKYRKCWRSLAELRRFLRRHAAMRRILFFPSLQPILPTEP